MDVIRATLSTLVLAWAVTGSPILDDNLLPFGINVMPPLNVLQQDIPVEAGVLFSPVSPVESMLDENAILSVRHTVDSPSKVVEHPMEKIITPVNAMPAATDSASVVPQTGNVVPSAGDSPVASIPAMPAPANQVFIPVDKIVAPVDNVAAPMAPPPTIDAAVPLANIPPPPKVNNVNVPNINVPTQNPNVLPPIQNMVDPNSEIPTDVPNLGNKVPLQIVENTHSGLPIMPANFYPISFLPFPIFPIGSNSYGVQGSQSYSVDAYPGPNGTIITEIHHQIGNSPPETTITIEKLPEHISVQETKPQSTELSNPIEQNVVPMKTVDKKVVPLTLEMDSVDEDLDGKNLGHLITLLEEIKKRIDLFKKDVVQVLQPIDLTFGPDGTPTPPKKHEASSNPEISEKPEAPPTRSETKPEVPPKTDAKPEEPSKTEEKPAEPSKTDVKPEEPSKTDVKPETPKGDVPVKADPPKTNPSVNGLRIPRSPYRGYGGPYGGSYGYRPYRPYYGDLYGGGYNGGWRPLYG